MVIVIHISNCTPEYNFRCTRENIKNIVFFYLHTMLIIYKGETWHSPRHFFLWQRFIGGIQWIGFQAFRNGSCCDLRLGLWRRRRSPGPGWSFFGHWDDKPWDCQSASRMNLNSSYSYDPRNGFITTETKASQPQDILHMLSQTKQCPSKTLKLGF